MSHDPRSGAEMGEAYCSFSRDCMCAAVKGRPDPECIHHRRIAHVPPEENHSPESESKVVGSDAGSFPVHSVLALVG